MNIDSSNLLSLLSSGESLEKLQQTMQVDEGRPKEFADTLLDKIRQLTGLDAADYLPENFTKDISVESNKQHDIAGLFSETGIAEGLASLFGKDLPIANTLEKDIDLENTLEALANVMNTLEDVGLEQGGLESKIELLVEKVETIRTAIPEQVAVDEKLDKVVDELQTLKDLISEYEGKEIDTAQIIDEGGMVVAKPGEVNDKIVKETLTSLNKVEKGETEEILDKSLLNQERVISDGKVERTDLENLIDPVTIDKQLIEEGGSTLTKLTENLEKVVDAIKQIKDIVHGEISLPRDADLETQIERLATEIESIKDVFSGKSTTKLVEKKEDASNNHLKIGAIEDADDNLELTNQIAAIVTALNEPQDKEKITVLPVIQESRPEQKKEAIPLKQMAEERALGISSKTESETLIQQENGFRKPGQDNPVIAAKQNEKADVLDLDTKKPEAGNDKTLPRFATDIANLNRAVMHENKPDVAPMTKHFAHPEWNKEVAERVIWMHKQEIPSAELRLNPRHLGPITIKVDVSQDQATVTFTAQHAAVKEAIEATLPKLREMFSAQQLNLAEVNVSQDDTGQRQARSFAQMGDNPDKNEQKERDEIASNEQADKAKEMTDEIESGRAIASNGILSIFA